MNALSDSILDASIGWTVLAAFSALWIVLGWYWGRRAKELDDYVLAGRRVGLALGTATAMATWVTSNTTMAAPQLALQMGVWGMLGYSLGAIGLLMFAPLAGRIRRLMPSGYTSGDFVRLRYGNLAWRIFLIISLCYSLGWLVSMGMAGGVLINALTGISYHYGMTVILTICVGYTLLGGFRAVIGTDFIQAILILVGLILIAVLAIDQIGIDTIHSAVSRERPELMNLLLPYSTICFSASGKFFIRTSGGVAHSRFALASAARPIHWRACYGHRFPSLQDSLLWRYQPWI